MVENCVVTKWEWGWGGIDIVMLPLDLKIIVPELRAWTSNYIPQYLWDVITCPCPWYLLLAEHSSFVHWAIDLCVTWCIGNTGGDKLWFIVAHTWLEYNRNNLLSYVLKLPWFALNSLTISTKILTIELKLEIFYFIQEIFYFIQGTWNNVVQHVPYDIVINFDQLNNS